MGRDTIVPPHYRCSRSAVPRTRQQRPHQKREHQNPTRQRAVSVMWGGGTTLPHHPTKAPTPKKHKHPHEHAPRVNTKPSHPPNKHAHKTSLLFHHPREHKKRPHSSVWAQPSVSATGEPWKSRRPARSEAQTHDAGTQTAHEKARKQPWFAPCAPAPAKGGQRKRKPLTIAHARTRG